MPTSMKRLWSLIALSGLRSCEDRKEPDHNQEYGFIPISHRFVSADYVSFKAIPDRVAGDMIWA